MRRPRLQVCGLYVEDLDLRLDDEHVRICGKSGSVRTVLLDDRGYVTPLKLVPASAQAIRGQGVAFVPLTGASPPITSAVLWRSGNESPVLRQFIERLGVRSQSSRPVPRPNVRILTVRAAP
ncbi:hypothetical protein [Nonomuraea sp. KM90]|uniref:hypothetical protein n=1 Tax=Nonomuraea sp. KM90 TaxID=3457428 RepID=UPI003FCE4FA8